MIKKLFLLALFCSCFSLCAQTIKTEVLIIGNGPGGIAAAIQSARSNVKTVLVSADTRFFGYPPNQSEIIQNNLNIHSGFWGEFCDSLVNYIRKTAVVDTGKNAPVQFAPDIAEAIIKKITDSAKNLTIYLNTNFNAIRRDGDRWEVTIAKSEKVNKFSAKILVDATGNNVLVSMLKLKPAGLDDFKNEKNLTLIRTSIAAGIDLSGQINKDKSGAWTVPLGAVIVKEADNLLRTRLLLPGNNDIQNIPFDFEVGQGTGATAAFCAFYKTTTKKLNVRLIQGELMNFKAWLQPFTDVAPNNPGWRSIQQVAATGLLTGVATGGQFLFKPDSSVNTTEVRPVLIETYTRAFLWFNKEKPGEKFTLGNLLSFISDYTLTDPELLNSIIQKAWKSQFHFKQTFNLTRPVNRLEFAVLANKYLNPFARTIDLDGKLIN